MELAVSYLAVPIIPIAVFTGGPHQKRPNEYRVDMLGTKVYFTFKSYHVFDHTEEELLPNPNPMAPSYFGLPGRSTGGQARRMAARL